MDSLMKVFDLVPVVQQLDGNLRNSQVNLINLKKKSVKIIFYHKITCITYSNTILYVGTIDG